MAAKRKKVATNSHPLAKPLPEGVILTDLTKGQWKVGKPIGSGGFGLLYLGQLLFMQLNLSNKAFCYRIAHVQLSTHGDRLRWPKFSVCGPTVWNILAVYRHLAGHFQEHTENMSDADTHLVH